MSWLFGIKSNPPQSPDFSDLIPQTQGGGGAGGGGGGGKEPPKDGRVGKESTYRFDSAALERAAEAAKNLERSPHAGQVGMSFCFLFRSFKTLQMPIIILILLETFSNVMI